MGKVWALIDANNYYVSCERLFNPSLIGVPVVVCGNLDRFGVIISRSQEAKALGIQMAQPAFQIEDLLIRHNVRVCASNYTLYADIHRRMQIKVHEFTPEVHDYSIDEFFLDLTGVAEVSDEDYGHRIRNAVLEVGVPTSIGMAPTKLLAKLASEIAKTEKIGVKCLCDPDEIDRVLSQTPPTDLWGVGSQYGKRLFRCGVRTALDLKNMGDDLALRVFGVVMLRMIHELRGLSCIPLDSVTSKKHKQYMCSRSFGKYVKTLSEVKSSLASFTTRAAERMRSQNQLCQRVDIFIMTNHFNHDHEQYKNGVGLTLPAATCNTSLLIDAACCGLEHIYKEGYNYKKAGVILTDICDEREYQTDLFFNEDMKSTKSLMRTVDNINFRMGQDTLYYAAAKAEKANWGTQRIIASRHYTTNWKDLLVVR